MRKGRRPLPTGHSYHPTRVRIRTDHWERLQHAATTRHESVASIIGEAIESWLDLHDPDFHQWTPAPAPPRHRQAE